jgi:predicted transcriptional regulator
MDTHQEANPSTSEGGKEVAIKGQKRETGATTPIDGLIRNLVLLEKVDRELEKLRRHEEMKDVRDKLQKKQGELVDAIKAVDDKLVREAKAIRSAIKRVGPEDAVEEITEILDASRDTRERVVQSVVEWEQEIGIERARDDIDPSGR